MTDLIIIGAGPAGIALAYEVRQNSDKSVLLLEKSGEFCQTIRTFYKDGKRVDKAYKGCESENYGNVAFFDGTKESTLELFEGILNNLKSDKFAYENACEVEKIIQNGDFYTICTSKGDFICKNYAVAIGRMGKPNKPNYTLPSSLKKVINFNANDVVDGEKILVVGGGNSAAEYAYDLKEKCQITMCYRQKTFSRLNDINLENINKAAQNNKLNLLLGVDILGLSDDEGKVLVEFNNEKKETFNRVIYAIGGSTPVDFLQKCGIKMDEKGIPIFDDNTMQIDQNGVFVLGDIASKNGASIIVGLNQAKKIADFLKNH